MVDFDLEAEVRDLAARRDIVDALQNYMRAQDRLLPDLHRSAFHEDGSDIDCGLFRGPASGFVAFAQGFLQDLKASQHMLGQIQIDFDSPTYTHGEAYFIAWHRIVEDDVERDLLVAGRYVDHYEKRDGKWAIVRRRELIDWARNDLVSDTFTGLPGLIHGARGKEDFSVALDWSKNDGDIQLIGKSVP